MLIVGLSLTAYPALFTGNVILYSYQLFLHILSLSHMCSTVEESDCSTSLPVKGYIVCQMAVYQLLFAFGFFPRIIYVSKMVSRDGTEYRCSCWGPWLTMKSNLSY